MNAGAQFPIFTGCLDYIAQLLRECDAFRRWPVNFCTISLRKGRVGDRVTDTLAVVVRRDQFGVIPVHTVGQQRR